MAISFGKEMMIDKLANHNPQNLCPLNTHQQPLSGAPLCLSLALGPATERELQGGKESGGDWRQDGSGVTGHPGGRGGLGARGEGAGRGSEEAQVDHSVGTCAANLAPSPPYGSHSSSIRGPPDGLSGPETPLGCAWWVSWDSGAPGILPLLPGSGPVCPGRPLPGTHFLCAAGASTFPGTSAWCSSRWWELSGAPVALPRAHSSPKGPDVGPRALWPLGQLGSPASGMPALESQGPGFASLTPPFACLLPRKRLQHPWGGAYGQPGFYFLPPGPDARMPGCPSREGLGRKQGRASPVPGTRGPS